MKKIILALGVVGSFGVFADSDLKCSFTFIDVDFKHTITVTIPNEGTATVNFGPQDEDSLVVPLTSLTKTNGWNESATYQAVETAVGGDEEFNIRLNLIVGPASEANNSVVRSGGSVIVESRERVAPTEYSVDECVIL